TFWRRPKNRERRQLDDPRDVPGRYRKPDGSGDLRGIQRHRKHGTDSRPQPGESAYLSRDGHRRERNAKRREASEPRATESGRPYSQAPHQHGAGPGYKNAPRGNGQAEDQRRASGRRWRQSGLEVASKASISPGQP